MRYAFGLIVFFLVLSTCATYGQPVVTTDRSSKVRERVLTNLQFEATMNDVTDANLSLDDGWIFTADSPARKEVKEGPRCEGVGIAGKKNEFLRFSKKTKPVLLYKAAETMAMSPRENWQGTVSFWLRVEPSELPEGYVDPFIVTQRAWNDAAFFVDFDNTTPRTFRLGAFSDLKHWNPEGTDWEKIPADRRPMVTVKDLPFSKTKWTHVALRSKASMRIRRRREPLRFTWMANCRERLSVTSSLRGLSQTTRSVFRRR